MIRVQYYYGRLVGSFVWAGGGSLGGNVHSMRVIPLECCVFARAFRRGFGGVVAGMRQGYLLFSG